MPSDRLPPPPAVPAEAREVAETWRPPRDMWPADELDRIFGPTETVDPGGLLEELGSLRADLRTIERAYWSEDEEGGGGMDQLEVKPVSGSVLVEEYDGFESIRTRDDSEWL